MTKFKTLDWHVRASDGVIYAEPEGLEKLYFIYPPNPEEDDENLVELVLIDKDGHFNDEESSMHPTVQAAQEHAQNHYVHILKSHILES